SFGSPAKIVAPPVIAGDYFGFSTAISGDTIVVGAPHDAKMGSGSGAAHVFVQRRDGGEPCTDGAQCGSGFCADGVCCDRACGGPCDVCAKSVGAFVDGACVFAGGYAGDPSCGAYVCDRTSADCPTS